LSFLSPVVGDAPSIEAPVLTAAAAAAMQLLASVRQVAAPVAACCSFMVVPFFAFLRRFKIYDRVSAQQQRRSIGLLYALSTDIKIVIYVVLP
jgi:hypothetical protein